MRAKRIDVPAPLAPGARIAVIAPGSAVRRAAVEAGMDVLRGWGYEPVAGAHLFARDGDLAGADEGRAQDVEWAFTEPGLDAVWAARGGWGTPRLLERLDPAALARSRRWLLGFSDVTALQAVLLQHGLASAYAPLVAELADPRRAGPADLRALLARPAAPRVFRPGTRRALAPGRAAGPLSGGCLTLLAWLAGTPWQPDLRGTVVFLEEVAEAPYRIDRMLWQLRAAGMLDGIAGLALGHFTNCKPPQGRPSRTLAAVLAEHAGALGVPVLAGIPAGHGPRPRALPLGFTAHLDADAGTLRLEPPPARAGR